MAGMMEIPAAGIEPATSSLGNQCSIQLSYAGVRFNGIGVIAGGQVWLGRTPPSSRFAMHFGYDIATGAFDGDSVMTTDLLLGWLLPSAMCLSGTSGLLSG